MTKILTISIPDHQGRWIKEQKKSPSKLFQEKVTEEMMGKQITLGNFVSGEVEKKLSRLRRRLECAFHYMQLKGLDANEFLEKEEGLEQLRVRHGYAKADRD